MKYEMNALFTTVGEKSYLVVDYNMNDYGSVSFKVMLTKNNIGVRLFRVQ